MSILSIQSHVAYGYVGNKAAVFPLQSMGYDVWPVHTVQFSNHTGYGHWQGDIFPYTHVRAVIEGIEALGVVDQCQAILSGYMGSAEICHEVYDTVQRFKARQPTLLYLCDPVIGNQHCFVKPEVLEFFKTSLSADIITPNQFEAETLSGIKIRTTEDAKQAAEIFHLRGISLVVITGVLLPEVSETQLHVFASNGREAWILPTPTYPFPIPPNGTGDLFSAVFLGRYLATQSPATALAQTVYCVDRVMAKTFEAKTRELQVTSMTYGALPVLDTEPLAV